MHDEDLNGKPVNGFHLTDLYRFSSNFPFLELDYPLSGAKCRYRHFALAV
jgi:hypothetical protein